VVLFAIESISLARDRMRIVNQAAQEITVFKRHDLRGQSRALSIAIPAGEAVDDRCLVTSRTRDDNPAFNPKMIAEIHEGVDMKWPFRVDV